MKKAFIPLAIFIALVVLLAVGLGLDPKKVPSPLINKPAPDFDLPRLFSDENISKESMKGKVWILNVWASWCVACRSEHEVVKKIAATKIIDIVGLNYKDEKADAQTWLYELGNPYKKVAVDYDGRTGINFGVYGVPESFLIDQQGVIRYKHIGPITTESFKEKLLPRIKQLQGDK